MRQQAFDNSWTNWMRSGGRYLLNGKHVNPTGDSSKLEVAATGELLTVISNVLV